MAADVSKSTRGSRNGQSAKVVRAALGVALVLAFTVSTATWLLIRDELDAVRQIVQRSRPSVPALASAALVAAQDPLFLSRPRLFPSVRCLRPRVVCCGGGAAVSEVLARYVTRPSRPVRWHVETKLVGAAISRVYEPNDLLAAYTNAVYLGTRNGHAITGAEAAANAFFGKRASQLTPAEAALLGALVRAPNVLIKRHDDVLKRRNMVLGRMRDAGRINDEAYRRALLEPVRIKSGA